MDDWNVVVSVHEHGFKKAFKVLQGFGAVSQTGFLNLLAMKVRDIHQFLEILEHWLKKEPEEFAFLARVIPVTHTFQFQSPEEFASKAQETVVDFVPQLTGKSFHVRMHRRGFKGKLKSPDEERFLDGVLLEALEKTGKPGHITFDAPDAIVVVETIGQWCGMSCWNCEQLQRYPFLKLN
ncbi:MAG: THUMP domain-containing protein [Nostocaceae cyanobacterium]|nr:THUMP domain-containing protein [Nostocaceae cyanobacterium]